MPRPDPLAMASDEPTAGQREAGRPWPTTRETSAWIADDLVVPGRRASMMALAGDALVDADVDVLTASPVRSALLARAFGLGR